MSKEKIERNKKIVYMYETEKLSFSQIASVISITEERISESAVAKIYRREKSKQKEQVYEQ